MFTSGKKNAQCPFLFLGDLVALFDDDDVDEVKQERNEVDKLHFIIIFILFFILLFKFSSDTDKILCLLESRTFITDAGSSTIYGVYRVSTGKL